MRPSIDDVRRLIAYEPITGRLTWLPRSGNLQFNGKYAGKEAGTRRPNGYIQVSINYRTNVRAHHVAWVLTHGDWPTLDIDHIDGDRSNNAINNLRLATPSQNSANSFRRDKNTSGYKGVSWRRRAKPWSAHIKHMGKSRYLGSFADPAEAHAAYCAAAEQTFGEFARVA